MIPARAHASVLMTRFGCTKATVEIAVNAMTIWERCVLSAWSLFHSTERGTVFNDETGILGLYTTSIAYEATLRQTHQRGEYRTPGQHALVTLCSARFHSKVSGLHALPLFTSPCFRGLEKTQRRRITFCSRDYLAAFVAPCAARLPPPPPGFSLGRFLDRLARQAFLARSSPHLLPRTCPRLTKAVKTSSLLATTTSLSNQRTSQRTIKAQFLTPLSCQRGFLSLHTLLPPLLPPLLQSLLYSGSRTFPRLPSTFPLLLTAPHLVQRGLLLRNPTSIPHFRNHPLIFLHL